MISVIRYKNAIVLTGDTKPVKDDIKELGGKFNKFLTDVDSGEKFAGWIFPTGKRKEVVEKLTDLEVEIDDLVV